MPGGSGGGAEAQSRLAAVPDYPITYVKAVTPPNASGLVTQFATCPPDHQLVSGGFDTNGNRWTIRASYPSTPRTWVVKADSVTPAYPNPVGPLTAYVLCAPESVLPHLMVEYRESSALLEWHGMVWRELTPDCRPDYRAIAGGFEMSHNKISLVRSQPNPGNGFRSWIVKAINRDPYQVGRLTAHSVCVQQDLMTYPQMFDVAVTGKAGEWITTKTDPCGRSKGSYLLSGGVGTPDPKGYDAGGITIWDHMRPSPGSVIPAGFNGWSARAKVATGMTPTVHAHALCGNLLGVPAAGGDKLSGKNPGWGDGMGGGRFK